MIGRSTYPGGACDRADLHIQAVSVIGRSTYTGGACDRADLHIQAVPVTGQIHISRRCL